MILPPLLEQIELHAPSLFVLVVALDGAIAHSTPIAGVDSLKAADGAEFPGRQVGGIGTDGHVIRVNTHTHNA